MATATKTTTAMQSLDKLRNALMAKFPSSKVEEILYFFNSLMKKAHLEHWSDCLVESGKFVEAVFKFFHFLSTGVEVDSVDVETEVMLLEQNIDMTKFERLSIPHTLKLIYEFAEGRGGIHNSSFDPIKTDCVMVVALSKWVIEELARLYLTNDALVAQAMVESLLVKDVPLIEVIDGDRLVLTPGLSARVQIELLLWNEHPKRFTFKDLTRWIHNQSVENIRVTLRKMEKDSLAYESEGGWILTRSGLDEAAAEYNKLENAVANGNSASKNRKKGVRRGKR